MIQLLRRIFDGGQDIFPIEEGVVGQNFIHRGPRAQQREDVAHADAQPANARTAAALAFADRDSAQTLRSHTDCQSISAFRRPTLRSRAWPCRLREEAPAGAWTRPVPARQALRRWDCAANLSEPGWLVTSGAACRTSTRTKIGPYDVRDLSVSLVV